MAGRVLIVDPIPTNRIVLKAKLGIAHYEVSVADSIQQAREIIARVPFEAILISTLLITEDDNCALKWVSAGRSTNPTAISYLFMHDVYEQPEPIDITDRCLRAGASDCIARPVPEEVLLARLRNSMRDRARIHELELPAEQSEWSPTLRSSSAKNFVKIAISRVAKLETGTTYGPWSPLIETLLAEKLKTGTIEMVQLPVLMQPDTLTREPSVIMLFAEHGMTERALSILSQMKSRARLHGARIILALESATPSQLARAFDLGADEALFETTHKDEVLARIEHQARIFSTVARRKQVVHDSLKQAITDPLTGLHNRRFATGKLSEMHRESHDSGRQFAVLALDIDHFKDVNDRFGHGAGDTVLTVIAEALRDNLREGDLICRTGGEEFLVALPHTDREQATATANRLRRAVRDLSIRVKGNPAPLSVTVSIGLVLHDGAQSISAMLEQADQELYAAKSRGRNIVSICASAA